MPGGYRRIALQRLAGEARKRPAEIPRIEIGGPGTDAGVVGAGRTGQVVRVILLSLDVPDHVAARVQHAQQVAQLAVHRQRRALVAILGVSRGKGGDLVGRERRAVRVERVGVEIAVRVHVLVVLLNEEIPILGELVQRGNTNSAVGNWITVGCQ